MAATERVVVYLTKEDKARVYATAKAEGESASEWAKEKLLKALEPTFIRKPMESD